MNMEILGLNVATLNEKTKIVLSVREKKETSATAIALSRRTVIIKKRTRYGEARKNTH